MRYELGHKKAQNVRKKILISLLAFFSVALCFAQFGGGEGTEQSPWEIETAVHLNNLRNYLGIEHNDRFFVQTANINLGTEPWNENGGWTPIGSIDNSFRGTYDGRGFTISGLTINPENLQQYSGLFGVAEGARLTNITLIDVNLNNVGYRSGALAGALIGSVADKCYAAGSIRAGRGNQISGLFGVASGGQINNCRANISMITEGSWNGGLVGTLMGGCIVNNSYTTGSITAIREGSQNIGGLLGMNSGAVVNNSYSTVNVDALLGVVRVGGLIGRNLGGTVSNCYAIGRVSYYNGANQEGGLIGGVLEGAVNNSYWNIESTGVPFSSGGEGRTTAQMIQQANFQQWDFDDTWNIGHDERDTYPWLEWQEEPGAYNLPVKTPPVNLTTYITQQSAIIINWNAPSFGEPDEYNIYRDDEYLATVNAETTTYQDNNTEDFTEYVYELTAVYGEEESERSIPISATTVPGGFAGGRGFADDPYQIENATHLNYMRYNRFAHYQQIDDIDLVDNPNWQPIGTAELNTIFSGSFCGNGYRISNLTIERGNADYVGLFGQVGSGANETIIRKVQLDNVNIVGRNFVGGLIGRANFSTLIDSCFVSGDIESESTSASSNVGGLIGYSANAGITNSGSDGTVTSTRNYVGGLIGYSIANIIENCFSKSTVRGARYTGGFAGYHNGRISNSYAIGSVQSTNEDVGGFVGYTVNVNITNSFSGGRVRTDHDTENIGGFVGRHHSGVVTGSYWDTERSEQQQSPVGTGRLTRQMTYPYDQETYIGWDFDDVWRNDISGVMNGGYPYLFHQPLVASPNPDIAIEPQPQHQETAISVNIENVSWRYVDSEYFQTPVGFRVYMDTSGDFNDDDDFVWIDYVPGQTNYATGAVLPDELEYRTHYYWKVIPTTIDPEDDDRTDGRSRRNSQLATRYLYGQDTVLSLRGDAQNVPVWRFTTEINPNPKAAVNPQPADEATNVSVNLERVGWSYFSDPSYSNPAGFRVYMSISADFEPDDDYVWVSYAQHQSNYTTGNILPEELEYNQTYYWKVVPTTDHPDDDGRRAEYHTTGRKRGSGRNGRIIAPPTRGDADNVPVWSFTTEDTSPNPQPATNPTPEHLATGVSLGLTNVSWEYHSSEIYKDPVGFRVYMNNTGQFSPNTPFVWVDYVEDQELYSSSEIIPDFLDANTTYFWLVVPTTNYPDDDGRRGEYHSPDRKRGSDRNGRMIFASTRGDAVNCPVWRFTTGTTDISDYENAGIITLLEANYPNPFNPETTINFTLAEANDVLLEIFNSSGQRVIVLMNKYLEAGRHQAVWNGKDNNNREVSSGIYFYRMKSGSFSSTKKMIMLK